MNRAGTCGSCPDTVRHAALRRLHDTVIRRGNSRCIRLADACRISCVLSREPDSAKISLRQKASAFDAQEPAGSDWLVADLAVRVRSEEWALDAVLAVGVSTSFRHDLICDHETCSRCSLWVGLRRISCACSPSSIAIDVSPVSCILTLRSKPYGNDHRYSITASIVTGPLLRSTHAMELPHARREP